MDNGVRDYNIEQAAKADPRIARLCNRVFDIPAKYSSYKDLVYSVLMILFQDYASKSTEKLAVPVAHTSLDYDIPFYLVSEELLEALLNSAPPRGLTVDTLERMGFPAVSFVLPKGIKLPYSGLELEMLHLMYSKDEGSLTIISTASNPNRGTNQHEMMINQDLADASGVVILGSHVHKWCENEKYWVDSQTMFSELSSDKREADSFLTIGLAALMACLLATQPTMISFAVEGQGTSSLIKRTKAGKEVHRPRYLGRTYKTKTIKLSELKETPEEATLRRKSPFPHWRRGHHRLQHYGKGNQFVKDIYVLPVKVKAED